MRNCSQHSVATFLTTIYRAVFMAFVRTRPKGSFINDVMQRRGWSLSDTSTALLAKGIRA